MPQSRTLKLLTNIRTSIQNVTRYVWASIRRDEQILEAEFPSYTLYATEIILILVLAYTGVAAFIATKRPDLIEKIPLVGGPVSEAIDTVAGGGDADNDGIADNADPDGGSGTINNGNSEGGSGSGGSGGGGEEGGNGNATRTQLIAWAVNSPWYQRVDGLPTHPLSDLMINDLFTICDPDPNGPCKYLRLPGAPYGGSDSSDYGKPVFMALPTDKTYDVACTVYNCGVEGQTGENKKTLFGVPIPTGAHADSEGTDGHMIVYAPYLGLAWDFWQAKYDSANDKWSASSGIRWTLGHLGYDTIGEPGSAVGAGTPLIGTVLTPEDVREAIDSGRGYIQHALSGGYDSPRTNCYIWPSAKKTDGDDGRTYAIPEGATIRLKPSIDIETLGLDNEAEKVIARTLQLYGMVIRDDSGSFSVGTEDVGDEVDAHPDRAKLWSDLGVDKNSLKELQGNLFEVVQWNPSSAFGGNCP